MHHNMHIVVPIHYKPEIKLCKNCKYYISRNERCAAFKALDVVNGYQWNITASQARSQQEYCGEDAKLFEEEKEDTNKL